jgi:hypothetical protein
VLKDGVILHSVPNLGHVDPVPNLGHVDGRLTLLPLDLPLDFSIIYSISLGLWTFGSCVVERK